MSRGRRIGVRVIVSVAIALFAALLLLFAFRSTPLSPERAAALRLLGQATPPVAGRDGSDALWLVGHAVPANQRADVADATRRWVEAKERYEAGPRADPRARYPRHTEPEADAPGLCKLDSGDCVALVRADPATTAALLAQHAPLLEAVRGLADYDGLRYGVHAGVGADWPDYKRGRHLRYTALAERFVRGERLAALAETCVDLAAWRRLGADNDLIVGSLLGASFARQDLRLIARMLAELPADTRLPVPCTAALAAGGPAELDLCPGMRTHFERYRFDWTKESEAAIDHTPLGDLLDLTWDPEHAVAVVAPGPAHACQPEVRAAQRADASLRTLPPPAGAGCSLHESLTYAMDCFIARLVLDEDLAAYVDRRTDLVAQLALMRTLLWLRTQSPDVEDWPALLPQRPASLGLRREPTLDMATGTLAIALLGERSDQTFELLVRPGVAAPAEKGSP